ncbi:HIT family protein [Stappia sp. MMSF_3263]|uniref:HIT family protein n=1 Tax=Stappia sp. MMSF_3263 TaxID=3046693 RepID=UPI00273E2F17|nr:HIT family protein [Stappia sp. MMSF_3263]
MSSFQTDPRLAGDSVPVCDLALCTVRLMRDGRFDWLLLVPRQADLVEIVDLGESDQLLLMQEIAIASRVLKAETDCDKLNVGALGNIVSQLHVHVIARRKDDPAWPGPVWGAGQAVARPEAEREKLVSRLAAAFARESG